MLYDESAKEEASKYDEITANFEDEKRKQEKEREDCFRPLRIVAIHTYGKLITNRAVVCI